VAKEGARENYVSRCMLTSSQRCDGFICNIPLSLGRISESSLLIILGYPHSCLRYMHPSISTMKPKSYLISADQSELFASIFISP
jgi:hypothetical protein